MKRLLKRFLKGCWRMTAPIRHPVVRRLDAKLGRLITGAIQSQVMPPVVDGLEHSRHAFWRIEHALQVAQVTAERNTTEIDLVLNGLIREIARLQHQVEALQDQVEAVTYIRNGLTLVDGDGDGEAELPLAEAG